MAARITRLLLLMLIMSLVLTPCSHAKLTFIVNDNTSDQEGWRALAEGYRKQTGVDVEVIAMRWADYPDKLATMLAGGVIPDVAFYSLRFVISLAAVGVFEDLTALRKHLPEMDDVFPAAFDEVTLGNYMYGIPTDVNVSWMEFNADLFDQAGLTYPTKLWQQNQWNWDTFLMSVKRLTRDIDGDGRIDQAGMSVTGTWPGDWPGWYWSNGATILDAQMRSSTMNSPQAVETLQFLADLINAHGVTTRGTSATKNNGQVGIWVSALNVVQQNRNIYPFNWGIVGFPIGPSGVTSASTIFGGGYVVFKDAPNKEEAYKFVEYLVSSESERMRARLASRAPAKRRGLQVFLEEIRTTPGPVPINLMGAPELVALSRPLPVTPVWDEMEKMFWEEVNPVLNARQSARAALESFTQRVNPLLASW
ncbi:MAG: sugar ABC transporter substrate-binding protein [Firmicutes bacterium]|nr:sugar ABC transporter substrate-binding protein [Bacillota bacterium]